MTTVRDLMSRVVSVVQVGATLEDAAQLMRLGRVRHLPVVDESNRLVGLLTQRDVLSAWVSHGNPNHERPLEVAKDIPVEMMMKSDVVTVGPEVPAVKAAMLIETHRFGCLPVVDGGTLVGIITEADFVKFARKYLERETNARPRRVL